MPDNVKMSLQNALTIAGLMVACAVSYSAIMSKVNINGKANERQDEEIGVLQSDIVEGKLERQRNTDRYERILESNNRIEEWIKTIELEAVRKGEA